jgi:uncharacterized protein (TIGR02598 family)
MKKRAFSARAFSLVEVVVALGLFAFCIVAITGLLSVGLGSTRSVVNEGIAVNIATSIFGAWQVQESGAAPLTVPGIFENLPALNASNQTTMYFDSNGEQVDAPEVAALEMEYIIVASGIGAAIDSSIELIFRWPVGASPAAAQTRTFLRSFVK